MADPLTITFIALTVITTGISYAQAQAQKQKIREAQRDSAIITSRDTPAGQIVPVLYGRTIARGLEAFGDTGRFAASVTDLRAAGVEDIIGGISGDHHEDRQLFLLAQYVIGRGGIEDIVTYWPDGQPYNGPELNGSSYLHKRLNGGESPPARIFYNSRTPVLRDETAIFDGLAYGTVVFKHNVDDPKYRSVQFKAPPCDFFALGAKLPVLNDLSADRTWGNTVSRVLYDYLTDDDYGPGLSPDSIDIDSFIAAERIASQVSQGANTADTQKSEELEAYNAQHGTSLTQDEYNALLASASSYAGFNPFGGSGFGANVMFPTSQQAEQVDLLRYEFNGDVPTDRNYPDAIDSILAPAPGAKFFRSATGKWKLVLPDASTDPNIQSVGTIDGDVLQSPVTVVHPDSQTKMNELTLNFTNMNKDYARDSVTYPERNSMIHEAFLAEDGDVRLSRTLTYPGLVDKYHAISAAYNTVAVSRREAYSFTTAPIGFIYEPGDILRVKDDTQNIDVFVRVDNRVVRPDLTIQFTATRFVRSDYAWDISLLDDVRRAPAVPSNLICR